VVESDRERAVHAEVARLARELHAYDRSALTVDTLLLEVTERAVAVLPGVDHAGVTLVDRRGKLQSTAATGPVPEEIDALQEFHHEGPCLHAVWHHHTVRVDDFTSEDRWPNLARDVVARTPVRSSLSVRLYTDDTELGALNMYSERPELVDESVEDMALALGAHAAIALSGARRSDQFRSALASRDIIGQAKGVIMERFKINALAAFRLLTKLSQDRNEPLVDVARQLLEKDFPPDQF
jgi:GAF domain-containing protein